MDNLLKIMSCMMLLALIIVQVILITPYRAKLVNDELNGRILKTYETLIYKGTVVLDGLGDYEPNSATVLINGIPRKIVDSFPVELEVCDGDVVEVQLKLDSPPFYVFLASRKGEVKTDLLSSTVMVKPGINRIFKVLRNN